MTLANTAIISLLTVAAPLVAHLLRRAAVPVIVVELLLGLAAGPHGLGWFEVDGAVNTLALLGVSFLFFLAGLEVDLQQIRGQLLGHSLLGYAMGLGIALAASFALGTTGLLHSPVLVAIAFSATGLGLVVPILRNASLIKTPSGSQIIAFASVAEFAAVVLLALAFSTGGSPLSSVVLLAALAVLAVVVTLLGRRLSHSLNVSRLIDAMSGGTVQLRVRLSVALVICFAALAQLGGLEVVLGAFFAGGILNVLDDSMNDPLFRARLDGLGYGFLIPVFFVASGARLDFSALSLWPDAIVLVPLLVLTLLVSRGAPAVILHLGDSAGQRLGAGLICATSLPFIVTAAQVGVATGRLAPSTAAAMTTAGLLGVLLFPAVGLPLLRRPDPAEARAASWGHGHGHDPQGEGS
jgi:Kef-type K+ transport system membrane component KefB